VKETAFSGAFSLRDELAAAGATVVAHDPMFSDSELEALGFTPFGDRAIADAAVVQGDHAEYQIIDASFRARLGYVFDGRAMGIRADAVLGDGSL
jgi:UDP-N-acetyl-D-mannosaminuronic acid dehydrogenase